VPRSKAISLRREIASIISPRRIRDLARTLQVVKRRRKIDVVALVAALTLGFGASRQRTLALLRRAYERSTGQTLAASAFYARLSSRLALLLKTLVEEAMTQLQTTVPALRHSLARFGQVLVADGSLLRLHDGLARQFPSVWSHYMKASAKLHVVINVAGRSAQSVQLTRGSRQDVRIIKVGKWLRGKLLIFDLAYQKTLLFRRIQQHGGFFLIRKKDNLDPLVVGGPKKFLGRHLSEITAKLTGQAIDLQVVVLWRFDRGPNKSVRHPFTVRLVGNWDATEKRYRFYLTNAPAEMLVAEHVGAVYAARWEVELFFRELKLQYRIEHLPTRKRPVAECLIYAALLTSLVSRRLRQAFFSLKRPPAIERWAIVFSTFALEMLGLLFTAGYSRAEKRLLKICRREGIDPNKKRLPLILRAQAGLLATR